jgi:hypothetical protein
VKPQPLIVHHGPASKVGKQIFAFNWRLKSVDPVPIPKAVLYPCIDEKQTCADFDAKFFNPVLLIEFRNLVPDPQNRVSYGYSGINSHK